MSPEAMHLPREIRVKCRPLTADEQRRVQHHVLQPSSPGYPVAIALLRECYHRVIRDFDPNKPADTAQRKLLEAALTRLNMHFLTLTMLHKNGHITRRQVIWILKKSLKEAGWDDLYLSPPVIHRKARETEPLQTAAEAPPAEIALPVSEPAPEDLMPEDTFVTIYAATRPEYQQAAAAPAMPQPLPDPDMAAHHLDAGITSAMVRRFSTVDEALEHLMVSGQPEEDLPVLADDDVKPLS